MWFIDHLRSLHLFAVLARVFRPGILMCSSSDALLNYSKITCDERQVHEMEHESHLHLQELNLSIWAQCWLTPALACLGIHNDVLLHRIIPVVGIACYNISCSMQRVYCAVCMHWISVLFSTQAENMRCIPQCNGLNLTLKQYQWDLIIYLFCASQFCHLFILFYFKFKDFFIYTVLASQFIYLCILCSSVLSFIYLLFSLFIYSVHLNFVVYLFNNYLFSASKFCYLFTYSVHVVIPIAICLFLFIFCISVLPFIYLFIYVFCASQFIYLFSGSQ